MKCDQCSCETFVICVTSKHRRLCEDCKVGKLREQQSEFTKKVALLILYAYEQGYELTFGDAYAKSGHKMYSFHYKRLAIDLNLFKDGEFLTETKDHEFLGEFWESMGGTWGGRFSHKDGNHYSFGE